jgi:hypothetical protein
MNVRMELEMNSKKILGQVRKSKLTAIFYEDLGNNVTKEKTISFKSRRYIITEMTYNGSLEDLRKPKIIELKSIKDALDYCQKCCEKNIAVSIADDFDINEVELKIESYEEILEMCY